MAVAIVDIGGRTIDFVVVQNQGIVHRSSGSLTKGMLDVHRAVRTGVQQRLDVGELGEQTISRAVDTQKIRLFGKDQDIAPLVTAAKRELVEQIYSETRRKLGLGAELDRVLFVRARAHPSDRQPQHRPRPQRRRRAGDHHHALERRLTQPYTAAPCSGHLG
jgi:hypothetical protein